MVRCCLARALPLRLCRDVRIFLPVWRVLLFGGAFARPLCLPRVLRRFCMAVACVALFGAVAFPLQCSTRGQICRVLAFIVSVGVLVWVRDFNALVG